MEIDKLKIIKVAILLFIALLIMITFIGSVIYTTQCSDVMVDPTVYEELEFKEDYNTSSGSYKVQMTWIKNNSTSSDLNEWCGKTLDAEVVYLVSSDDRTEKIQPKESITLDNVKEGEEIRAIGITESGAGYIIDIYEVNQ